MMRIEMLAADYGDCLWVEYGRKGRTRRILIDCGTAGVWPRLKAKIEALPKGSRRFELFVVTHIDADHIGGAVAFLRAAKRLGVTIGDVWFNGYKHLSDTLGAVQAEELTGSIEHGGFPWNHAFGGSAIVVPDSGPLPTVELDDGLRLTIVSPTAKELAALEPEWERACRKAGIVPGEGVTPDPEEPSDDLLGPPDVAALAASPFKSDTARPNGSSIAFVTEFEGDRALFTGDAFSPVVVSALKRLTPAAPARLPIKLLKLSHHGSRGNTAIQLARRIDARHVLISSSGARFRHPNSESIARVIAGSRKGLTLTFNYRTQYNDMWDNAALKAKHKLVVRYRKDSDPSIGVTL